MFGDAERYVDDPRYVLMFDMLAGDYADEVRRIVEEALEADRAEDGDADGMLCLGDAVRCVNRAIEEAPSALGGEPPKGGWTRLSMRAVRRLTNTNPDFSALVLQARLEANWLVNGREAGALVRSVGTLSDKIRWFKMLADEAYRADQRVLDRVKLRLATEKIQSVARSLDAPFRSERREWGRPALRSVPYAADADSDAV